MTIAALDSAERTGYALVSSDAAGERLARHGVVLIRSAAEVEALADELAGEGLDVVAIEEPFVHPRNPATGLALARLLGRWLQAFETRGLTVVTVPASMWQPATLPGFTPRMCSAERKAAAVAYARERFGVDVGDDAADAIALGVYVARHASRPGERPDASRRAA